jgi:hypothetical protein
MEFTSSKTRAIYTSHLLAALVSAAATIYLLWKHVPHGTLYWIQLSGIVALRGPCNASGCCSYEAGQDVQVVQNVETRDI